MKHNKAIVQYAIDGMDNIGEGQEASDLHHELFNTDYFIIGTHQAKQWLEKNPGVFEAIEEIKTYEQDNFGEVTTDLSDPEKVVNMYAYIKGEEVLQDVPTLQKRWNKKLRDEDIDAIKSELKKLL
jgi:hypothetical protein